MNTNIKKSTVPRIKNTVKEKKNLVLWLIWIQLIIISIILGFIAVNVNKNNSTNVATLQLQKKLNDRLYVDYNSNYEMTSDVDDILADNLPSSVSTNKFNEKLITGIRYIESYLKITNSTEITQNGTKTILNSENNYPITSKILNSFKKWLEPKNVNGFILSTKIANDIAGEHYRVQLAWFAYKKKQQEEEKLKLLNSSGEETSDITLGDNKISFNY